ncbi:hypothetical protein [Sphingomonas rubra]|uniref:5-bromo-4-chloroindolyl phosphate hydrolysis protein n=1 Tax=Sphingomonas rubra TaxID=634430 RepID=A0A1I5SA39_9SPHN|nr:hypothetical protein [Sphingomonas rubra]SFP67624.1 hypothetical protein SAMN04488241_10583 [Sphingomonas rubra]
MSEVDDAIAAARASWSRIAGDAEPVPARRAARRNQPLGRRLKRIAIADAAILAAAMVIGMILPTGIGIMGAVAVMALLIAATVVFAVWPAENAAPPRPEKLREVDLRALPAQTERWLQAQRRALPAPAQHLVDRIGDRLDTLSPQLGRIEPEGEQALEIRRLVGEQLPAFVADYARVPEPLRRVERNGRTPDGALVDGLGVIEREIAGMTERLAQGDLDSLQTRGRFLEMKYQNDR